MWSSKTGGMMNDKKNSLAVILKVNGRDVAIKQIVQDMIGGGIAGMVAPLKGVDQPKKIEIEVTLG